MTALPFGFYDLIDQFAQPGCAICQLLLTDVARLLDSILYEYATDPEMQADFRASLGLCAEHGWQMIQLSAERGGALNIAKLYERPLEDVLTLVKRSASATGAQAKLMQRLFLSAPHAALIDTLEPTRPCVACKLLDASEAGLIAALSDHVDDPRLHSAYADSEGLCLPHFRMLLKHTQNADRQRRLLGIQEAIWGRLNDDLAGFIRKSNFQHADEPLTDAESTSWQRVVARLGGERGVFGPRRITG
ncbi:MAG: DUF6062 family protein [Candidatus Flexifilum sp.]|jgi:hypothetical protein